MKYFFGLAAFLISSFWISPNRTDDMMDCMKKNLFILTFFVSLLSFESTGNATYQYNYCPFAIKIGKFQIKDNKTKCEPSDLELSDIKTGTVIAVLPKALKSEWLFQVRNGRYLYYIGRPPSSRPDEKRALLMFDLRSCKTDIIFVAPTLINFEISQNEKMAAVVHKNGNLEILNLMTKKNELIIENDAYRRNTVFKWPKSCWESTVIQFMGWSRNARDLWFMLKTPDSGVIFARVTDSLLEEFDYFDTVADRSAVYGYGHSPYALKRVFNVENGLVFHMATSTDESGKKSTYWALTDLVEQKTARIEPKCSEYKWKNKNEFFCRGRKRGDTEKAAKYLCIQQ